MACPPSPGSSGSQMAVAPVGCNVAWGMHQTQATQTRQAPGGNTPIKPTSPNALPKAFGLPSQLQLQYMWLKKQHQLPLTPSRLLHIPSLVAEESLDLDECVRSGVNLQVDADGVVDPTTWQGSLSIYKNSSGYSYYRLAGTRALSTKYQGLTIQGWAAVDPVTVRMYLSSDPTAPTPEPPKRPAASMLRCTNPAGLAPHKRRRCSGSDEDVPTTFNTALDLNAFMSDHALGGAVPRAHMLHTLHNNGAAEPQAVAVPGTYLAGSVAVPPSDAHPATTATQVMQLVNGRLVPAVLLTSADGTVQLAAAPAGDAGAAVNNSAVEPQLVRLHSDADSTTGLQLAQDSTNVVMTAATLTSLLANAAQGTLPQAVVNPAALQLAQLQQLAAPASVPVLQALPATTQQMEGASQQPRMQLVQAGGQLQLVPQLSAQPMMVLLPQPQQVMYGGNAAAPGGVEMWAPAAVGGVMQVAGMLPAGAQVLWCGN